MRKIIITLFFLFSATLLTAKNLKVISYSPSGNTENIRETTTITVTFNEPMIALKKLGKKITSGPIILTPAVKGKYKWLGTRTLSFYPDKPLTKNSRYKVTISKKVKSVKGNTLRKNFIWYFNTVRPRLKSSTPYNNSKLVDIKSFIYLYFSQPMELNPDYITLKENGIYKKFNMRYIKTNELQKWRRKTFNRKTAIVLEPDSPFNIESKIEVFIKAGMPAIEGNLGTKYYSKINFYTYYKFKYIGDTYFNIQPFCDCLSAKFSNPVDTANFRKHLKFSPDVKIPEITYSWHSRNQSLDFNYKPETHYKITIDKNLTDIFKQKLGHNIVIEFDVGSYPPYFSIPTGLGIIEAYEGKKLPLKLRNPENMEINTTMVKKNDLIPYLLLNGYVYIPWRIRNIIKKRLTKYKISKYNIVKEKYNPDVQKNKFQLKALYLSKYLNKKRYGLIDFKITGETGCDYYKSSSRTFLQITDMGITGKFSPEGNLIFVTALKTGLPLKNIDIEIRDDFNKLLYKGKTDKNGILKTPGWYDAKLKKYRYNNVRQWAIAKKSGDLAFIHSDWGTGISPWRFNIHYNGSPSFPHYKGTITTERGIYRPNETVHFKGILRERRKGNWIITKIKKLNYKLTDSGNKVIKKGFVRLTSFGTFLLDIKIPKKSPTGYYSLRVYQKEQKNFRDKLIPIINKVNLYHSFRVEVFQPVQYEVRIWAENKKYYNNDTADFKVTGWYLFGAPMKNKKIHYVVRGQETFYTPPNNPGYRFSILRWLDDKYYSGSKYFKSQTSKLNNKGEISIPIKLSWGNPVHAFNVWLEATVYGENSQRVSSRKSLLVFGSRFYIGLKRDKYFIEKGKSIKFKIITVTPDGKRRKNDTVKIKVFRRYWESVRKAEIGGRYSWQSKRVDKLILSKTVKTKKSPVKFLFIPRKTGLYYLRAEANDKDNNIIRADEYFYSIGSGYTPWQMNDDDRIELVADKQNYKPGDTAKVLIKSPYDKATALITVEREFIIDSWVKQIQGSAAVVNIPIKKKYLPNIFVGVSLIKGRIEDKAFTNWGTDLGKPSFKIGYTSLNISPDSKRLFVDIIKDHSTREPGDPLTVKFKVKDINGNPVKSECMVAVCDVGVLNLIGFKTPNFFNTFYGPLALNVQTSDSRLHIIGQRNYGEKGEDRGGGGAREKKALAKFAAAPNELDMDIFTFRKNFLSTAFYKGNVITDKNGNGKVKFNVPDNLTTFRIMVVPATKKSYFGAGEDYVVVKKYLMLKSTLPQFAIVEDEFQAGSVVYNYTDSDNKIKLQIEASNANIIGKKFKTVFIKKGESADVRFNIKCSNPGNVKIKIAALSGKYNDAVEKVFPVKVPRLTESVALFESTDKKSAYQKIVIPAKNEVFGNVGNFSVYLSSSVFSKLKSGIDYLIHYPYGCIEQKISKILPIIFSKKLILDLKLTRYSEKKLDSYVKTVLKEIPDYQRYDGGFDYWKDKRWSYPWLTAYVSFAMIKAKKEGYKINKNVLRKSINYLQRYARRKFNTNLPYSYYADLSTKSFIAYVLAAYGKPNKTLINKLYKIVYKIPFFGKANLLKALYYAGYKKKYINKIRQILFNKVKVASTTAHYEDGNLEKLWWIHSSSVRATATILQAFLETQTYNSLNDKVANWLVQAQHHKGRYNNTQDNVYAFYAMAEYYKHYENKKPDFKVKLIIAGKKLLEKVFKGRNTSPVFKNYSFDNFPQGKELNANILKIGTGRIYYNFRLNYAPRKLLKSRDEGIKIEKWYETLSGEKIQWQEFEKGKDYVVVIKINTEQERHFVMVNDPIPAGFKILNLNFQTESQDAYKNVKKHNRWWSSFNHFENYEDRVLLSATSLYFGEHIYRYVVRAVTPGKYLLPPTKAEEMYNPDVFGYYGQQYVVIK